MMPKKLNCENACAHHSHDGACDQLITILHSYNRRGQIQFLENA